jgi:hypothetical protein
MQVAIGTKINNHKLKIEYGSPSSSRSESQAKTLERIFSGIPNDISCSNAWIFCREYSMVSDLKADTAAITETIDEWIKANADLNNIEQCLKANPVNVKGFYNSLSHDFWHFDLFKYDNKTVEELKSSGTFRLIRSKSIENAIMSYDLDMKYILIQEQDVKELMNASKDVETKIADYSQINFHNFKNYYSYCFLIYYKRLIGEYYNKLSAFKRLATYHEYLFTQIKMKAETLIKSIQSQYNLKDE